MRASGPVVGRPLMFLLLLASGARASPPAPDSTPKPPPAELQQRVEQAMKGDEEPLSREECQALTGWAQPLEACTFEPVAGGKAALLQLTTACGGDSCDVQVFVYRRVELYRVELRTGKASPWVKGCFSPALSPKGRWILCRNRRGDVLKVPLSGGTPTLVHRSGLSAGQVYWTPSAYLYPDAVSFPSPERLQVTTIVVGKEADEEERRTVELPWKE